MGWSEQYWEDAKEDLQRVALEALGAAEEVLPEQGDGLPTDELPPSGGEESA